MFRPSFFFGRGEGDLRPPRPYISKLSNSWPMLWFFPCNFPYFDRERPKKRSEFTIRPEPCSCVRFDLLAKHIIEQQHNTTHSRESKGRERMVLRRPLGWSIWFFIKGNSKVYYRLKVKKVSCVRFLAYLHREAIFGFWAWNKVLSNRSSYNEFKSLLLLVMRRVVVKLWCRY